MNTPVGLAARHTRRSWASIVQHGPGSAPHGEDPVERVGGGFSSPSLVSPPSELPAAVKAQQRVRQRRLTLAKGGPPPLLLAHLAERALAGAKRTRDAPDAAPSASSSAQSLHVPHPTPFGERRASGRVDGGAAGVALALAGQVASGPLKPAKAKERKSRRSRRSDAVAMVMDENEPGAASHAVGLPASQKKMRMAAVAAPSHVSVADPAAAAPAPPPQQAELASAAPTAPSPRVVAPAPPPHGAEGAEEAEVAAAAPAPARSPVSSPLAAVVLRRSPRLWSDAGEVGGLGASPLQAPGGSPALARASPPSMQPPSSAHSARSGAAAAAVEDKEEEGEPVAAGAASHAPPAPPSSVGALVREWGLRVDVAGAEAVGEGVGRHTEYTLRTACAPGLAAAAAEAGVLPPPVRRRYRAFATLRDELVTCSGAGAALRRAMRGRAFPPKAMFPWRRAVIAERTAGLGAFSQAALELAAGGGLRRCCAKSVVVFLGLVRPRRQAGRGRE